MEKDELYIYYSGGLNKELDKALEETLKLFGYEWYASGIGINNIRDLAFDKIKEK